MTPKNRPFQIAKYYAGISLNRYRKLHIYGKISIWLLLLFYVLCGLFIVVITPNRIAQYLYDRAQQLSHYRFGWLVLAAAIVLVSFPPFIGHTTLITLCGFAYGLQGFYIAAPASLVGSGVVFAILRFLFSKRLRRWSGSNEKWQALEAVVRAKGLPLIILIRMSPFPPWVYSNSLFASIEPVNLWQFVLATVFVCPKILLYVFTGSRIARLSDGNQRGRMDTQTKVANALLAGGGLLIGIITSIVVYRLVKGHIRHLPGIAPETDELAAEAFENIDESAPLLQDDCEDVEARV